MEKSGKMKNKNEIIADISEDIFNAVQKELESVQNLEITQEQIDYIAEDCKAISWKFLKNANTNYLDEFLRDSLGDDDAKFFTSDGK